MVGRNEVTIDVVVRERGGKRVLKDVGDEAKKTGTSFGEMAKDSKSLQKQLFEMDIQIRKTAQELERTGDKSLVKVIQKQRRELNALVKVRKDVLGIAFGDKDDKDDKGGGAAKALRTAGKVGGAAGSGLTESLMALRGPAIGAAVIIGAALTPAIGGVIASAVLGGVGTGGIIGGIALASRDPRVQDAGAELGHHAMAAFSDAAKPFVGPTIEAIGVLRGVVDDVSGDMRQAFATIAPTLVPLTQGLGGFFHQMMPGIIKALEGARPIMLIIRNELPKIGAAFGHFFATIAEDPRGAIQAFQDLSHIIQGTIVTVGNFISFLSFVWGKVGPVIRVMQGDIPGMAAALGNSQLALQAAAQMGKETATSFTSVADSAKEARNRINELNGAIDSFIGIQLGVDQATVQWNKGLIDLKKELLDGKRVISLNTDEGLRNREALLNQIEAAEALRQKTAEQTGDLDAANAQYEANIKALYAMGIAAGFSAKELEILFAPYAKGPQAIIFDFEFRGLAGGVAMLRQLARLTGSNAAAARALGEGQGTFHQGGDPSGYGGGRASGGLMAPGMTYDVAESGTGVERIKMLRGGGAVVQNADQWSAAGGGMSMGGGGGAQTVNVVFDITGGGNEFTDLIVKTLRRAVTDIGGGNVQRTLGRNDR